MNARPQRHGFTLIELIVAIVLLGIIGSAFGMFILPAFQSYQAVERRAELTDAAESALRRMARDIRIALPNSVRVTNTGAGFALEMIPTIDGGRYCIDDTGNCTDPTPAIRDQQVLDFPPAVVTDAHFDILGCFRNAAFIAGATAGSTEYRLAIGNAGTAGADAYEVGSTVITSSGGSITLSTVTGGGPGSGPIDCGTSSGGNTTDRHHILIGGGGFAFGTPSTRERVFVIETASAPVSYFCDTTAGINTLTRYAGYAFAAAQPPTGAATGAAGRLVANNVTGCSISTNTLDAQNRALVTISLTISNSGETITLMQQVQLDNSI